MQSYLRTSPLLTCYSKEFLEMFSEKAVLKSLGISRKTSVAQVFLEKATLFQFSKILGTVIFDNICDLPNYKSYDYI